MTKGDWILGESGHVAEHNDIHHRLRERPSASDFGVKGNGATDDTAAIQSAIDTLIAGGGDELFFPRGTYKLTAPLQLNGSGVRLVGSSKSKTRIVNAVSNIFEGDGVGYEFAHLDIQASSGHIFALDNLASSHLHDLNLRVSHAGKSICHMDTSVGGSAIHNVIERCRMEITPQHTVPAWYHLSSGNVNLNVWRDCFCVYSGDYFFWIENTSNQNWAYDNRFENIVFEITVGGSIKLLGCNHALIENCHEYDLHAIGAVQRDLYFIGAGGLPSRGCTLMACGRRGGVLAAGVYDINIDNARYTTLIGCGADPEGSYAVQVGLSSALTQFVNDYANGTAQV